MKMIIKKLMSALSLWCLLGGWGLTGCATMPGKEIEAPPATAGFEGLEKRYAAGQIIEPETGDVISFDQMMARLATVQVVFIGEQHDDMAHHRVQLRIISALVDMGHQVSVGLEMFSRQKQPALDGYVDGKIAEGDFLAQVGWDGRAGWDFDSYKEILRYCRDHRLPILGLNAPDDVVKKVARQGLGGLSPEERSQLASSIAPVTARQKEFLTKWFGHHQISSVKHTDRFVEAHLAWEETMAETIAQYVTSPAGRDRILVVLSGAGHVVYKFGIPDKVTSRGPVRQFVVIPAAIDYIEGRSRNVADFVWLTEPDVTKARSDRPRMGIYLAKNKAGAWTVESVKPDTPAARAGFLPGDVLQSVNGRPIIQVKDIHQAVIEAGGKAVHRVIILRNGQTMELRVTFDHQEGPAPEVPEK
ncbi:MAG: ChaN family lipoprotein [Deltaproteobacteria bacterium]|nr:ChaN family lipoprotein [Deltaproteobacteria bacterium]